MEYIKNCTDKDMKEGNREEKGEEMGRSRGVREVEGKERKKRRRREGCNG